MNRLFLFSLVLWFSLAFSRGVAVARQQDSQAVIPTATGVPSLVETLPDTKPSSTPITAPTSLPTPYPTGSSTSYLSEPEDATFPSGDGAAVEDLVLLFHDRAASRTIDNQSTNKVSLPDLQTLPPSELRLVYDPTTKRRILRFTNSIWNSGLGQLELTGRPNRAGDHIQVYQRLFADEDKRVVGELEVGEFIFHDQHRHWHLDDFAQYEVRSIRIEGGLGGVVAAGSKLSYCILDISRNEGVPPRGEYSRVPGYITCNAETQGLSPGWVDVYGHHLPRQWVDITNLPDGVYALVSIVNPDQFVLELDVENNIGVTYFELKDMRVRVVEEPDRANIPSLLRRLNLLMR